jgi:DNA (cytosine-5)-methyltransferase 1
MEMTEKKVATDNKQIRFIDLFCGIGGFHTAAKAQGWKAVMACDINEAAAKAYEANYGLKPVGDIRALDAKQIPDHEVLLAGFPCQPFSICGDRKGFQDARGTLFFEIARILEAKQPPYFVLENVKMLAGDNGGKTIKRIVAILRKLGYTVEWKILNALNFGLPQKRERVLIVGRKIKTAYQWPVGNVPMKPLEEILEKNVPRSYYASPRIRKLRQDAHKATCKPAIWHQNKGGNISSHPYSCALRAGASYNYLLVDGIRRPTPRELLRLQGFPDTFKMVGTPADTRTQAGNAVPVPLIEAVLHNLIPGTTTKKAKNGTKNKGGKQISATVAA